MVKMENDDCSSFGEDLTDTELYFTDLIYEDIFSLTNSSHKLQIRKDASKANWNSTMTMAEVVERKGRMLISTGIVRNGKTYCLIEEALFLAELGALIVEDEEGESLPLKNMYGKVAEGQSGCSWEAFLVYRHLKSFGYIVGRHGVPWSLKSVKAKVYSPPSLEDDDKVVENDCKVEEFIVEQLGELQIKDGKIVFDVYLPNSKFRKSSPGDPMFVVSLAGECPPSTEEIEALERQSMDIPVRIANIEHGRITFFSFNKVDLPVLP